MATTLSYSPLSALNDQPDGRTRDGRLLKSFRAELEAKVGGDPSIMQRAWIDQAAHLALAIARLQAKHGSSAALDAKLEKLGQVLRYLGIEPSMVAEAAA